MFVGTFCLILVVRCNPYIDYMWLQITFYIYTWEENDDVKSGSKNELNMFTGIGDITTLPLHLLFLHW